MPVPIDRLVDLDRFPLDRPDSQTARSLLDRCREDLDRNGMFNLRGFVRPDAVAAAAADLAPRFGPDGFDHRRTHNIYFRDDMEGVAPDHPALRRSTTSQRTLCADRVAGTAVEQIYEWPPLASFLAAAMGMPRLHTMADPLARVNVMRYGEGQQLGWHFDRSEFTVTLLLQAPDSGGEFEYRTNLRSGSDPNLDGVARLLEGRDPSAQRLKLEAGTLNVFRGLNTPHRVTPVEGSRPRMIAVLSFYDRPGVRFSREERIGFYGRAD